jgi:hypothetical protein
VTGRASSVHALAWTAIFAIAFALVEAAVVVYLRAIYYPAGFSMPLVTMADGHVALELGRELATLVMLLSVAWLAGRRAWERFGLFCTAFGVWDIFYYVWLKFLVDWPAGLLDWDVLFLIPVPWIGPVFAPATVSCVMISCGAMIFVRVRAGIPFHPPIISWIAAAAGILVLLYSFTHDTEATLRHRMPAPYRVEFLFIALFLFATAFGRALRTPAPERPS